MNSKAIAGVIGIVLLGAGFFIFSRSAVAPNEDPAPIAPIGNDKIRVSAPLANSSISSPVIIKGEARGTWYFEASFPIKLLDANGKQLAIAPAQAQGDPDATAGAGWMTEEFVPFELSLTFPPSATETGTIVLMKDNPSGLPEHDDSISIPVRFTK